MSDNPSNEPLTNSGGESKSKRLLRCRIAVFLKSSLCLNVLLLIVLVTIFIVEHVKDTGVPDKNNKDKNPEDFNDIKLQLQEKKEDDILCLPCNDFGDDVKTLDTIYDVITTSKCGQRLCCLTKQPDLQRFLIKIISASENGEDNLPANIMKGMDWWRRPYAAHLSRNKFAKGATTWTPHSRDGLSFINGLNHTDEYIRIPDHAHGVYFIYSVVTQNFSKNDTIPVSFHQIFRKNPYITNQGKMREDILLMAKYGGTKRIQETHTSVICRVVKLSRSDRVGVRFGSGPTNQEYIQEGMLSNYFGMFKL